MMELAFPKLKTQWGVRYHEQLKEDL